jgi:carboxylesterase type B
LLAISPDVMLAAHARLVDELAQTSDPAKFGQAAASAMPFQPTYGTSFLPQRPIDAVAAGSAADIDVMVGTTSEEALSRIPAIRLAEAQSQHNPNSWMYRFDWRSTTRGGEFGACHLLEVPFAFDRLDNDQAASVGRVIRE